MAEKYRTTYYVRDFKTVVRIKSDISKIITKHLHCNSIFFFYDENFPHIMTHSILIYKNVLSSS